MSSTTTHKVVAVIGRPNVGKSTLFNRILGSQRAIVHDIAGVTRDRHYAEAEWAGKGFTIIDTGGFIPKSLDVIERAVREQAQMAIEEADSVIFVVDASVGATPLDYAIAEVIRKWDKKVLLTVNKVDGPKWEVAASEFYSLGLGSPFPISALNGRNIGDFLDLLVEDFQGDDVVEEIADRTKIAIIGRPNVGKSSLANVLVGRQRSIVTEVPGTTRDSIDSVLRYKGEDFLLIDTAGLRKRNAMKES
ncbi:MAG: ribosome biogenesis GTPase Der, partial [Bacteroidota bacterium]